MKKSFKIKLAIYFGLVVLVVALILGTVLTTLSASKLEEMRSTTSEKLAIQTKDTISNYVEIYSEAIDMMSIDSNVLSTPFYKPSITWLFKTFENFVETYDSADFIYIGYDDINNFNDKMDEYVKEYYGNEKDADGNTISELATYNAEKGFFTYPNFYGEDYDHRARGWYDQAMNSDELVWTASYIDAFTGLPVITIAKQIKDDKGNALAVIGADISLSTIADTYADFKIGNTGTIFITDGIGQVISHPDPNQLGSDITGLDFWDGMSSGESGTVEYEYEGVEKQLFFTTEPTTGWKVAVTFKDDELSTDINPLIYLNIIIMLICVVVGVLIALVIATKITKDLNKVNTTLTKVANGDLTEKVEMERVDEIGQMGQNLNKTIDTLNEIVNEINVTSNDVKMNTDNLTKAISETTLATEEIAHSIQDVAKGTNTQAIEVQDGSDKTLL